MSGPLRQVTKIMVLRHAEKPAKDFEPVGVTLEGKRESESLTVRGWQRAGALANLFAPTNGHFQHASLARPQLIYASKPLKRKGSRRPIETMTPLAEKLAIKINKDFPRSKVESMLEEVFLCKGTVLICWQREYLPQIAAHILGNKTRVPQVWPEDRFDLVWVFDRDRSSDRFTFKQVPQRLLMGDWTTPIKS
jgi:hypothetical protein